jgi:hypothetical protein
MRRGRRQVDAHTFAIRQGAERCPYSGAPLKRQLANWRAKPAHAIDDKYPD